MLSPFDLFMVEKTALWEKRTRMSSSKPLKGLELVDCAKANAKQGIEVAAGLCGYGEDVNRFHQELEKACDEMGVKISELSDLITDQQTVLQLGGIEVAPDTPSEL
jgi:activator of 2-hydroxyglutaryl-CoA dehydratase